MKVWHGIYSKLITKQNIVKGYREFLKGKRKKRDVINYERGRKLNLETLHSLLVGKTYKPGGYSQFIVHDPKTRIIHKANVQDRIIHHLISDFLEQIFEETFIEHSYSCRKDKGTHKGVLALRKMGLKESRNNTRTCWMLKMDISKFFASVNHKLLLEILRKKIKDEEFINLLEKVVHSFYSDKTKDISNKKGVPIGNLTSQFFSNIYLNEFDQFVKHQLKVRYYIRYADDFVFISHDKEYLVSLMPSVSLFLKNKLDLDVHPKKILIRKFSSGVDFLGYVVFPLFILPRTSTKKRLLRKIRKKIKEFKKGEVTEEAMNQTIQSYYGFLTHAHAYEFKKELQNLIWFWLTE